MPFRFVFFAVCNTWHGAGRLSWLCNAISLILAPSSLERVEVAVVLPTVLAVGWLFPVWFFSVVEVLGVSCVMVGRSRAAGLFFGRFR